jgi:hypothetical protein
MRPAATITLLLTLAGPMGTAWAGAGVAGGDILKIPVEARGWGLGGAYSAIADDVGALAVNPAGMAQSSDPVFRFTFLRLIGDSNFESLLASYPLGRWGTIGGMLLYRQVPSIDNGNSPLIVGSDTPVTVSDSVYGLYLAFPFSHLFPGTRVVSPLSVGIGLKKLTTSIANFNATSTALDIGALWSTDVFRFAIAGQNLGGGYAFPGVVDNEADPLPQTLRTALAYIPFEDASSSWVIAVENSSFVGVSTDQKSSNGNRVAVESFNLLGVGVEYWRLKKMGVRIGYVQPYGDAAVNYSGSRALTVGVSFRLFTNLLAYQVDIGYRPIDLGSDKQGGGTFSLSLRF